jgi:hypothetical protein
VVPDTAKVTGWRAAQFGFVLARVPKELICYRIDGLVDIIGRNFKQPKEGLGLDNSPSAHMWRTMMWPTRFL